MHFESAEADGVTSHLSPMHRTLISLSTDGEAFRVAITRAGRDGFRHAMPCRDETRKVAPIDIARIMIVKCAMLLRLRGPDNDLTRIISEMARHPGAPPCLRHLPAALSSDFGLRFYHA